MTKRDSTGRRSRGALSLVALVALAVAPLRAAAEPSEPSPQPVRLSWTRAAGAEACPEASVIEADVTARLGESPFRPDAPGSIDVQITRERGEWSALIEERPDGGAPAGSRVVTSAAESCDSLALAVGLAIALMIRARASEPVEAPPPVPVAAAVPPPAPPAPPCDVPNADAPHVATLVTAVAAFGVLPQAALGVSVNGRIPAGNHAWIALALTFLPEQHTDEPSGDYAFGATWGELGGCYATSPGPVRFAGCAAALLGALHVVVADPVPLDTGAKLWGAASLGLRADFSPGKPWHLVGGVDGLARFVRHTYAVELGDTTETVFTEPRFAALVSAGIGVEL
ncbi:MAG TPA: hypothetical protein VMS65_03275 [Polyangiaceae bacterium]|nr:hypothetical protein [Polyangiaceae bacterium]